MIWKTLTAILGLAVIGLTIPAFRHLRERPPSLPPVLRAQLAVPAGVTLGSGAEPLDAAISADEQAIAFVATRSGTTGLWVQSVTTGVTSPVAGTDGAALPAWSPDGQRLAFFAQGRLRSLAVASGAITDLAEAASPGGVAWLDDDSVVFGGAPGGILLSLRGGVTSDVTRLAEGDEAHGFPFVDEAGRLLYVASLRNGTRVVRLMRDGNTFDLTQTSGHAELRGGVLVHVRDNVLLAQRLDENATRLVGRSAPLATGVGHSERGHGYFATSSRMALWSAALPQTSELVWFDGMGQRTGVAAEPGDYWQVRLSPSGRDAAVTTLDPLLRTLDVMILPLASPGNTRRVSLAIGPDTDPVWSPNAGTVLYRSAQAGPGVIVSRPSASSSTPETNVLRKSADLTPTDWRDETILFHAAAAGGTRAVSAFNRQRADERLLTPRGFSSWDARWSADGAWIAYASDEAGQAEIYVQAWPSGSPRIRATFGGGQRPRWGRGGTLYFLRGSTVMRATLTASPGPVISTPQTAFSAEGLRDFSVSPAGDRFLAIVAGRATQTPDAHIILNWATPVPPLPKSPARL